MIEKSKLPPCPVETTLLFISNKWKVLILRELQEGVKRFNEMKRTLEPISQKVLTQNLRDMEKVGIVERRVYPVVPPKVEYSLTELGESLKPILDSMVDWGNYYKSLY